MFNIRLNLFLIFLAATTFSVPHSLAQQPSSPPTDQPGVTPEQDYHESALRRFEIVTLSSLPFTAVHSYLGVRTVRMVQENKIAPVLTPKNYRVMGISAVSLTLFIGIWDWFHTRNVDRSAPSVPERKEPVPPTEEVIPSEGPFAFSPSNSQHSNMNSISSFIGQPHQKAHNIQLNMWKTQPAQELFIPLLQIRF